MASNEKTGDYEQDFTPKTAKRKISKTMLISAAIVIVLAGLGIAAYFFYEGNFYYQTDNAKVDTMIYQLTADASGKLVNVYVSQNETVSAGQVLVRVTGGSEIKSPINGTVIDIKMEEGDYATPSDVVMIVAKTSDIFITANVEETEILKIHKGQSATVTLDAYGRSFDGYVQEVNTVTSTKLTGPVTSFTTSGTYTKITQLIPVKIRLFKDLDLADIIGTNATVKIRIK
ncbi:MAG TPA: efflux RND transporter periplasmic adaptor subunit [Anaerolineaceae bacterium]|nr:efflux RND transporter periplasmic adaptor subunit [Anaerolineaceae bacterium]